MSRDMRRRAQLFPLMPVAHVAVHPSDEYGAAGDDLKRRSG